MRLTSHLCVLYQPGTGSGAGVRGRSFAGEPIQDAAKQAEDAAGIVRREGEPPQQQAKVVAVGGLHGERRVASREHGLFDQFRETVEVS